MLKGDKRLAGVHSDLQHVVMQAARKLPFDLQVVEGVRTEERQQELYAQGRTAPGKIVTWTKNSKHIEGRAVDLAPLKAGAIDWSDLSKFKLIADAMMAAAAEVNVKIRWGGNWDGDDKPHEKGETDSPHFELVD